MSLRQGDGVAHARLALGVVQVAVVADAVFLVLDDDVHFGALRHEVAGQAQGDVVGILVLVQFVATHPADGTGVGASVSAHHVEARACQAVACHFHIVQLLAKERLVQSSAFPLPLFRGGLRGGLVFVSPRRKDVFHAIHQFLLPLQAFLVQLQELFAIGAPGASVALQESGDAFAPTGGGSGLLGREKTRHRQEEKDEKESYHIYIIAKKELLPDKSTVFSLFLHHVKR